MSGSNETPRIYIEHEKIHILSDALKDMKKYINEDCLGCDSKMVKMSWLRLNKIITEIIEVK